MIVGVGASWTRASIDCLVDDPDDIIQASAFDMDEFNKLRNETDEFFCRAVSFLLTEIKPVLGDELDPDNPYHPIPFVEFYNNAKDMDLSLYTFNIGGTFSGKLTAPNSIVYSVNGTIWPLGTYLVLFDSTRLPSDIVWCAQCLCTLMNPDKRLCEESIYIACDGTDCQYNTNSNGAEPTSVDNWNVIIYDDTEPQRRIVMDISYGMGGSDWTIIDQGFTYELIDRDICNPEDGKCWKQSCTVYGTPGWLPIECNTCQDPNCQIGGDKNATCNAEDLCDCKDGCYNVHDEPQCNCVVPPVNCSIILNTDVDGTGIPAGYAQWSHPDIDWSQQYTVRYEIKWHTWQNSECAQLSQVTPINQRSWTLFDMEWERPDTCGQSVRAIVDFGDNPYTPLIDNEIYYSDWLQCYIKSPPPSLSPTLAPTLGLPPIHHCNVTLSGTHTIDLLFVEWTKADVTASHTFNKDQFKNDYKVYLTYIDTTGGADRDDLLFAQYKVRNQTSFETTLNNDWNSTHIVNGKLEIKISPVLHELGNPNNDLDVGDPEFNQDMYIQATICDIFTQEPTPSPTPFPTQSPTDHPSSPPTISPTIAPTYSWWVLGGCVIEIRNNAGTEWHIRWVESNPNKNPSLPENRRIYVKIDGIQEYIFNEDDFSPQDMTIGQQIIKPDITSMEVELIAEHLTQGSDDTSFAFSPNTALCRIETLAPTDQPTLSPITDEPTLSPYDGPTLEPSSSPTQPPTYYLEIKWCHVLLLNDNYYAVTFKIPQYKDPVVPPITDVQYVVYYDDRGSNSIKATDVPQDVDNITIIRATDGIDINYETDFEMTTLSIDGNTVFADRTKCDIFSIAPTSTPSTDPTKLPTSSPTHPQIGAFVYSDDGTVCDGYERCACHVVKSDFNCIGSDYPEEPQIEDTRLAIIPSDGQKRTILHVGRYPYSWEYPVEIKWRFIYLNETREFNSENQVQPTYGSTLIGAREHLGEIVQAQFLPTPNEQRITEQQWYRFEITSCSVIHKNGDIVTCGPIYPDWAYVIWTPPEAVQAMIIGGGDPWPDWIFYLLLGASITAVLTAYCIFVWMKNKNLKNNAAAQNLESEAMLSGIAPSAHVVGQ